jgi:hypothetical protein
MGKKIEVPKCLHPMEQAFDQPREDGSEKIDKICGVCGFTMCEVVAPAVPTAEDTAEACAEEEVSLGTEDQFEDPEGATDTPEAATSTDASIVDINVDDAEVEKKAGQPLPYVSRDPDKVSEPFTRQLPVPVPDEELADHAKEMARLHNLWVDTKLKAKAFAKSCKSVTDKAEEDMVTLGAIIREGTEERAVSCRWEFDYAAGVKKLRRLDNHQICDEETLQGDELHLSFNFQQQSEDNVSKFFEKRESEPAATETEPDTNGDEATVATDFPPLTSEEISEVNEAVEKDLEAETEPVKETSAYVCKACGHDPGSHIYMVRHLRDTHGMKLSEYKAQYPTEA